jgi:hypothetical protein
MVVGLRSQLILLRRLVVVAFLPATVLLFVMVLWSSQVGFNFGYLTRDPSTLLNVSPAIGFFSNLGILMWTATVVICFFTAAFLSHIGGSKKAPFFMFSGFVTLLLLIDDLFLVHEFFFPRIFGLDEFLAFAIYGLVFVAYVYRFRSVFPKTNYLLLVMACCLFGVSLLFDMFHDDALPWHYLLEDGAKWFGIVSWFAYYSTSALNEAVRIVRKGGK